MEIQVGCNHYAHKMCGGWEGIITYMHIIINTVNYSKKKCWQYWPDIAVLQPNTSLQVTLTEHIKFADYEIRRLEVEVHTFTITLMYIG